LKAGEKDMDFETLLLENTEVLLHETTLRISSFFQKNQTHITIVESALTQGQVGQFFSNLPYANQFLDGFLYLSNLSMFLKFLGIQPSLLKSPLNHGVLSMEIARIIQKKSGSHLGVSVMGVEGQSEQLSLHVACVSQEFEKKIVLPLKKEELQRPFQAGEWVAQSLLKMLENNF